jgi:hypothetical protein
MNSRGWYVQPALSFDNSPAHIHLSISASNVQWVDRFLADLETCVAIARTLPDGQLAKLVKGDLAQTDFADLSDDELSDVLKMAGLDSGGLPQRTAEINEALDALAPETRNLLLINYVNDLFKA